MLRSEFFGSVGLSTGPHPLTPDSIPDPYGFWPGDTSVYPGMPPVNPFAPPTFDPFTPPANPDAAKDPGPYQPGFTTTVARLNDRTPVVKKGRSKTTLFMELPGVEKKNINIIVAANCVIVTASRKKPSAQTFNYTVKLNSKDFKKNYSFSLQNGILKLVFKRKKAATV